MDQGPSAAPAALPGVTPDDGLLDLPPGVVSEFVLPRLSRRHRAALALTCRALRRVAHDAVKGLVLPSGRCCVAAAQSLHLAFPSLQSITITPSNLHEAMNVVPSLIMTVRRVHDLRSRSNMRTKGQGVCMAPDQPPDVKHMIWG